MWVREFLATHPIFRVEDFRAAHEAHGSANEQTAHALLAYHVRQGNVLRIQRGLLASVPPGYKASTFPVDPFLLTMGLTEDAVVAFHAALQFHGVAHSVHHRFQYLTVSRRRPFSFRNQEYIPVSGGVPSWRVDEVHGVTEERHAGGSVRVTTLERTLVDVMTFPQHGGGWEEVYRSLDAVEFLDVDRVATDAVGRDALTAARVGLYLEGRRKDLPVMDRHLEALRRRSPRQAWYMGPGRRPGGRLVKPWNLVVPEEILEQRWEEPT